MKNAPARLKRLQRLERIREIAKQAAATEAAKAEGTLAHLIRLSEHTSSLAAGYRVQTGPSDGASLQQASLFARELLGMSASTAREAREARIHADARQSELASAERRRAAVDDRARLMARDIAKQKQGLPLGARRTFGTGLE